MSSLRAALRPVARPLRAGRATVRAAASYLGGLPARGGIAVSYGHPRLPSPEAHALGGIVKLQALQRLFPNAPRRFNVLYLVTSRLPDEAVLLARCAGKKGAKVVVNQNGVAYPGWHGPGWEQVNEPMARLLPLADHVFYQSEFCKQSGDRYLGERSSAYEVLYNAVDTDVFAPDYGQAGQRVLRLMLGGSQDAWYRVETALQVVALVARQHPQVELLVTGRLRWMPDETEALCAARQAASALGIWDRVRFLGAYRQSEAPGIFRRADILLHTKYNDPCPTVVIEAMACALPVVYSHSGGVPELVGAEAGVGIPAELSWERDIPPDPAVMAEAVLEVAERRGRMAEAARQRAVERFDLRPWLCRHREVFEGLLG